MMESLSTTIEAKDEYTRGHSRRVAQYAALIAKNMGWTNEEIQNLKKLCLFTRHWKDWYSRPNLK